MNMSDFFSEEIRRNHGPANGPICHSDNR